METNKIIDLVSQISAFLGEGLSTYMDGVYCWYKQGEVVLHIENMEIQFVDCELDMKTYFAIVGLAHTHGLTTNDYFIKK